MAVLPCAAEVSVFEPLRVVTEGDDFGAVDELVDHGGGGDLVAEHVTRRLSAIGLGYLTQGVELSKQGMSACVRSVRGYTWCTRDRYGAAGARRMPAMVGMGSLVRKSSMIALTR